MYFLFSKLCGWGKSPAIRPQTLLYGVALCKMCPNHVNEVCTSLEKVAFMDNAVLRICGIAYGDNVPWAKAAGKARSRIFETEEFHNICACCQWYDLCRRTEVCYE